MEVSLIKRVSYKFDARVVKNVNNESDNDFIQENFGAAFVAFNDRPLIGSGLGAFHGVYSSHEVHSTYLKMLGETGIIGTIGYVIFIVIHLNLNEFWVSALPSLHFVYFVDHSPVNDFYDEIL